MSVGHLRQLRLLKNDVGVFNQPWVACILTGLEVCTPTQYYKLSRFLCYLDVANESNYRLGVCAAIWYRVCSKVSITSNFAQTKGLTLVQSRRHIWRFHTPISAIGRKSPGVPGAAMAIFADHRDRRIKSPISDKPDIGDFIRRLESANKICQVLHRLKKLLTVANLLHQLSW